MAALNPQLPSTLTECHAELEAAHALIGKMKDEVVKRIEANRKMRGEIRKMEKIIKGIERKETVI